MGAFLAEESELSERSVSAMIRVGFSTKLVVSSSYLKNNL
jgi:hypothetical protein